jgi:FKBP-type peptidyl-prolyl cis-trans isomerase FkpA
MKSSLTSYRVTVALVLFLVCFASCKSKRNTDTEGYFSTPSGLRYKFIDDKKGSNPGLGDIMLIHILYKTDKDSVLFNSATDSDSFKVKLVEPTFTGGVEEGFAMMSPGDSALFKVSADSLFRKTFRSQLPSYLTPGRMIYFQVKMKSIIPKHVLDSIHHFQDIENRKKEFAELEKYLQLNNMDVQPTENGVYMVVKEPGTGDNPVVGDTIFAEYEGRMLNGNVFDKSHDQDQPFKFVLGRNMVIQGWEEAIPLLRKGARATMVIPSDLAYGAEQFGKLPPYSTLVFDVYIKEIKKGIR